MNGRYNMYTTKIIKSGAILTDTRIILSNWDPSISTKDNYKRIVYQNILGKNSRSRLEDIVVAFRQRYEKDDVIPFLLSLNDNEADQEILRKVLYYFTVKADDLLYDVVSKIIELKYRKGLFEISIDELTKNEYSWIESIDSLSWSLPTTRRVVHGQVSTLRDFGILEGDVNKRIAPPHIPLEAFVFIAFYIHRNGTRGKRLVHNKDWSLFLLDTMGVERNFIEAHQERLLQFEAAGDIYRVDFPMNDLKEYADYVTSRAY